MKQILLMYTTLNRWQDNNVEDVLNENHEDKENNDDNNNVARDKIEKNTNEKILRLKATWNARAVIFLEKSAKRDLFVEIAVLKSKIQKRKGNYERKQNNTKI